MFSPPTDTDTTPPAGRAAAPSSSLPGAPPAQQAERRHEQQARFAAGGAQPSDVPREPSHVPASRPMSSPLCHVVVWQRLAPTWAWARSLPCEDPRRTFVPGGA